MINFKELVKTLLDKNIISEDDVDEESFNTNDEYKIIVDNAYLVFSINVYEDGLLFMTDTDDFHESEISQIQIFENKPIMEFK